MTPKYKALSHAMQSGVAMEMNYNEGATSPKHLRVGVNCALVETGALANLLIEKGLATRDEVAAALEANMQREVERYKRTISERLATPDNPHPNIELA